MVLDEKDLKAATYIGERIRFHRTLRDLSVARLAEMTDIDPTYLTRIEKGANPSMIVLCRIVHQLDVGIDDILPSDLLSNSENMPLANIKND